MTMREARQPLGYRKVLPGMLAVCMAVGCWEVCTPRLSHSGGSADWIVTVLLFPFSTFILARHPGTPSRFFVFGVVGALLHLPCFVLMDRFQLWIQCQAPTDTVLVLLWGAFACGLGFVCWQIAVERDIPSHVNPKSSIDARPIEQKPAR